MTELGAAKDELIAFGRASAEAGLLASTGGNASLRLGDGRLVVTGSGAVLAALTRADLAVVRVDDGEPESGPRPSMELEIHRLAYRARPDVGAVLHGQSEHATLLACMAEPPTTLDLIPEIPAYVRRHVYVPFALPGTRELAESIAGALADPDVNVVQLTNHGQVIVGASWREAVRRGTFFELASRYVASGLRLRTISPEDAAALRDYGRPRG